MKKDNTFSIILIAMSFLYNQDMVTTIQCHENTNYISIILATEIKTEKHRDSRHI